MLTTLVRGILNHYPFLTPRASLLKLLPETPDDYGPFGISHGLKIDAYPTGSSDHVVKSLFWLGSFDPWVCSTLTRLAMPGTTALDIGANIGLMTMHLSQAVGPTGTVFSFEPAPDTCLRIRNNVLANKLSNVEVNELALSDRKGVCRLVVPDGQNGMARIGYSDEELVSYQVPMITFDEWVSTQSLGPVSVCKIDVEGHEPNVLDGMKETLAAGQIDAIVFEDHEAPTESLTQASLRSHGFQIFRMFKTLRRVHYRSLDDVRTPPGTPTADYVAVRPDREAFNRVNSQAKD
jgi:FkbM family methyltransferase